MNNLQVFGIEYSKYCEKPLSPTKVSVENSDCSGHFRTLCLDDANR
jgi:hypothetical protein